MRNANEERLAIPDARDISWRRIPEPDETLVSAVLLPLATSLALAVFVLWVLLTPFTAFPVDWKLWLATATLLVPLHEFVHLAAFPRQAGAQRLRLECAVTPASIHIAGARVLTRDRYLWVLAAPFVVLSVLPAVAAAALGAMSGPVVVLSLFNALASAGDVIAALFVLATVPRGALVYRRGTTMTWQGPEGALPWPMHVDERPRPSGARRAVV